MSNHSMWNDPGGRLPVDSYGRQYEFFHADNVSAKEDVKVCHDINNLYHKKYEGKRYGLIVTYSNEIDSPAYTYLFEIHGFGEYNIYQKTLHED